MSGLCSGCRTLADALARLEGNPAAFQLAVGEYAKQHGHARTHDEIHRLYAKRYGVPTLDEFVARPAFSVSLMSTNSLP